MRGSCGACPRGDDPRPRDPHLAHEVDTASAARRPSHRGSRRIGGYEFEARSDQAKRRLKGVAGPAERRDDIVEFLGLQLEPGHPAESPIEPEQRLPQIETFLDQDELVENVADQPGTLRMLVVDLQDIVSA